jgi:hypothetical protein
MRVDIRSPHRTSVFLELIDRVMIVAHVSEVRKCEDANHCGMVAQNRRVKVELIVLGNFPLRIPFKIDPVGDGRLQRRAEKRALVAVFIVEYKSVGVASRIGGVVPCATIIDRPVQKLHTAVTGYRVDVEKSGNDILPTWISIRRTGKVVSSDRGLRSTSTVSSLRGITLRSQRRARQGSELSVGFLTTSRLTYPARPNA